MSRGRQTVVYQEAVTVRCSNSGTQQMRPLRETKTATICFVTLRLLVALSGGGLFTGVH